MTIALSLHWIEEIKPLRVLICSDSNAALQSIKNSFSRCRHENSYEIMPSLYRNIRLGVDVQFLWVPTHSGVKGNKVIEHLAKQGIKVTQVEIPISISKAEPKSFIWNEARKQSQRLWDGKNKKALYIKFKKKKGKNG